MAREPEDPRVTDLRRYRKAREEARRRPPPKPRAPRQGLLGDNPRAGLILAIVAGLAVIFLFGPALLQLL
jgi:hypothetical protein